jgi:hypothetical protein
LLKPLLIFLPLAMSAAEAPEGVLNSFTAATSQSDRELRGARMDVRIFANVPSLDKTASLQGVRKVLDDGAVTYDSLLLTGDESLRHQVIARYLEAEENRGGEHDFQALALTPANYKFQFQRTEVLEGRSAYVFRVKPRHKREGSFQGDLWIDATTYLPLRESGRVVAHSIFLRRLTMVRKFRIVDHVALPETTELDIDTRIAGHAQMRVELRNMAKAVSATQVIDVQ